MRQAKYQISKYFKKKKEKKEKRKNGNTKTTTESFVSCPCQDYRFLHF